MIVSEEDYLRVFECIPCNIQISADDDCDEDEAVLQICHCKTLNKNGQSCFDKSCINVATQTECVKCSSNCRNRHFTKQVALPLQVIQTNEKGFGLVTKENLSSSDFVIEFVGELVNETDLLQRMKDFDGHLLSMQLKDGTFIDATKKGSISRFLNHSCDPNCRIEVWSVHKKYRVGVFAIKNIDSGTELTIDYDWEPSAKGLTKCYCNSMNCRGFIEKLTDPSLIRMYTAKTGLWLSRKEVPPEALDANSCVTPSWLVGKRIKVWWDGNQAFLEADVRGYDSKKSNHQIQYVVETTVVDEFLRLDNHDSSKGSDWMWLDESREEASIRKKQRIQNFSTEPESSGESVESSSASPLTTVESVAQVGLSSQRFSSPKLPSYLQKIKRFLELPDCVALRIIANKRTVSGSESCVDYFAFKEAMDILSAEHNVSIFVNESIEKSPNIHLHALQLSLWGIEENVTKVLNAVSKIQSELASEQSNRFQKSLQFVQRHQPSLLARDWRQFPAYESCVEAASYSCSCDTELISLLYSKTISLPPRKGCLSSKTYSALRSLASNVSQGAANECTFVWSAAHQNLLSLVIKCGREVVGISNVSILHSSCLLLRLSQHLGACVDFGEMVTVSVAILMLALKARGDFKPKLISKLIIKAYCIVYNRDEESCNSNLCSLFEDKVFAKEHGLFKSLNYDIYITDVASVMSSLLDDESTLLSGQIRPSEHLKRLDFFIALGVELCLIFVSQLPCLYVMAEPETMLCGSVVFADIFVHLLGESRTEASSQAESLSLLPILLRGAVTSMGFTSLGQVQCVVDIFASAAFNSFNDFKATVLRLSSLTADNEIIGSLLTHVNDSTLISLIQSAPVALSRLAPDLLRGTQVPILHSVEKKLELGELDSVVSEGLSRRLQLMDPREDSVHLQASEVFANKLIAEDFEIFSIPLDNAPPKLQALVDGDSDRVCGGLRSWPTTKQLHRESKSLARYSYDVKKPLSALALSELSMLQQLQDSWMVRAEGEGMLSSHFATPIDLYLQSATDNAFVPLTFSSGSSKSRDPPDLNLLGDFPRYSLVLPPALYSLQEMLPHISHENTDVNKTLPLTLSLDFVMQLCEDMFSIVSHCTARYYLLSVTLYYFCR